MPFKKEEIIQALVDKPLCIDNKYSMRKIFLPNSEINPARMYLTIFEQQNHPITRSPFYKSMQELLEIIAGQNNCILSFIAVGVSELNKKSNDRRRKIISGDHIKKMYSQCADVTVGHGGAISTLVEDKSFFAVLPQRCLPKPLDDKGLGDLLNRSVCLSTAYSKIIGYPKEVIVVNTVSEVDYEKEIYDPNRHDQFSYYTSKVRSVSSNLAGHILKGKTEAMDASLRCALDRENWSGHVLLIDSALRTRFPNVDYPRIFSSSLSPRRINEQKDWFVLGATKAKEKPIHYSQLAAFAVDLGNSSESKLLEPSITATVMSIMERNIKNFTNIGAYTSAIAGDGFEAVIFDLSDSANPSESHAIMLANFLFQSLVVFATLARSLESTRLSKGKNSPYIRVGIGYDNHACFLGRLMNGPMSNSSHITTLNSKALNKAREYEEQIKKDFESQREVYSTARVDKRLLKYLRKYMDNHLHHHKNIITINGSSLEILSKKNDRGKVDIRLSH